jgi:hypothetical protein
MINEFVLREWVERIGKRVCKISNEPARNRIELNEQHTGFIMESNDSTALSSIGWAIEKHLNEIPSKLKPTFQNILEDTRTRKVNLERS